MSVNMSGGANMMVFEMELEDNDTSIQEQDDQDEEAKFILSSTKLERSFSFTLTDSLSMDTGKVAKIASHLPEGGVPLENGHATEKRRKGSTHSVVSNAQIQLQMLVEDVKEEIKEFAHELTSNYNNNNNNVKTENESKANAFSDDGTKVKVERTGWQRYIGIILAVTSSMIFALCILIVKMLANVYHPYSMAFWRFQGVLLPSIPIAFYCRVVKKQPIFNMVCPPCTPQHRRTLLFVLLRCITGSSAVVLQFYSLQYINMADSSVIVFSTPVFVSLAAAVLLKEKSGIIPVLCGIITLLGVCVITRPPLLTGGDEFDANTLIGAGMALGSMFCAASTFLLLRYLRQMHFSVITILFGLWGSFQSLTLAASISRFEIPDGQEHWVLALTLAALTFLGQTMITLAFKFELAGTVALCRTFDIVFSYVWQFIFLGILPDVYSFIGGGIVILGVLIAAFRKLLMDLPAESGARRAFWILLK